MKRQIIKPVELRSWIDNKKDFLLVNVMNPEYFTQMHIKGSINAPVYEVAFLTYLEKLNISKDKEIIVHGEKSVSLATEDAAAKLLDAGYENVHEFSGGFAELKNVGFEIEHGELVPIVEISDGEYALDVKNSVIAWSGRNLKYAHHGKIAVKYGNIVIKDRKVFGGKIVLDMSTIKDEDLTDEMWRGVLESHLKSSDFFDTAKHGEACFEIIEAKEIANALSGTSNYILKGELTIKDVTREFQFEAMISALEEGVVHGQAHFDFDRTLWNVRYGSEKFFEKLGMHLVNDIISLEIFLVAKK